MPERLRRMGAVLLAQRAPARGGIVQATVVSLLAAAELLVGSSHEALSQDGLPEPAWARDCLELPTCPSHGVPSSFLDVTYGGLWIKVIAALRSLGLGVDGPYFFAVLLAGAAVGLTYHWVWRWWNPLLAAQSAAWAFLFILIETRLPAVEPETLPPFPAIALLAIVAPVTRRGTLLWAGAAGLAVYALIEAHVSGAMVIPPLIAILIASCHRPAWGLAWAGALAGAAGSLTSREALVTNLQLLALPQLLLPALGAVVLAVAVGLRGRSAFPTLTVEARYGWCVAGLMLWYVLLGFTIEIVFHRPWKLDYEMVVLPPLVLALTQGLAWVTGGLAAQRPSRRWLRHLPAAAAWVIAGALPITTALGLLNGSPADPTYTMGDIKTLWQELGRQRLAYEDVMRHLRGPRAFDIADGLVLWTPSDAPLRQGIEDIRILKVDRAAGDTFPRASWTALDAGRGEALLVGPIPSWVRPEKMELCVGDDIRAAACASLSDSAWKAVVEALSFRQRLFGLGVNEDWAPGLASKIGRGTKEWLTIPVVIDSAEPYRAIDSVVPSVSDDAWSKPWKLDSLEGVDASVDAAHGRAEIRSTGGKRGVMRWVRETGPNARSLVLPQWIETRPDEESVRIALRHRGLLNQFVCQHGLASHCG